MTVRHLSPRLRHTRLLFPYCHGFFCSATSAGEN